MTARIGVGVGALRLALRNCGHAVERARLALVAAIQGGEAARAAERAAIAAIGDETQIATGMDQSDLAVEAFAAWLPEGRRAVAAARADRDRAEVAIVLARAGLAAARSAEAAAEALLEQVAQDRRDRAARAEQGAQDEAAIWASYRANRDDAGR